MTNQTRRAFLRSAPVAALAASVPASIDAAPVIDVTEQAYRLKAALELSTGTVWEVVDDVEKVGMLSLFDSRRATTLKQLSRHMVNIALAQPAEA